MGSIQSQIWRRQQKNKHKKSYHLNNRHFPDFFFVVRCLRTMLEFLFSDITTYLTVTLKSWQRESKIRWNKILSNNMMASIKIYAFSIFFSSSSFAHHFRVIFFIDVFYTLRAFSSWFDFHNTHQDYISVSKRQNRTFLFFEKSSNRHFQKYKNSSST